MAVGPVTSVWCNGIRLLTTMPPIVDYHTLHLWSNLPDCKHFLSWYIFLEKKNRSLSFNRSRGNLGLVSELLWKKANTSLEVCEVERAAHTTVKPVRSFFFVSLPACWAWAEFHHRDGCASLDQAPLRGRSIGSQLFLPGESFTIKQYGCRTVLKTHSMLMASNR